MILESNGESIIESIDILNDNEVKLIMKKPQVTNLEKVGTTRILPKHIWENIDDPNSYEGEGDIVGSGPYMFDSYNPEQGSYRLVAFKDYFGKKPTAEAIEYIPIADSLLAFENEEIDFTTVSPDMISRFEGKDEFKMVTYHGLHAFRLEMNVENKPELADKNIRQAITYGINRQNLVDTILRGVGEVAPMGYVVSINKYFNPNANQYEYNPEKAIELMGGKEFSMTLNTSNAPQHIKVAELIKLDLEKIGINLDIVSSENKTNDAIFKDKNYEMIMIMSGGLNGPQTLANKYYSYNPNSPSKGIIGYSNLELDEILDSLAVETDEAKKKELSNKAQEIVADDAPVIMLISSHDTNVYRPEKYDGWTITYDHNKPMHPKRSFTEK